MDGQKEEGGVTTPISMHRHETCHAKCSVVAQLCIHTVASYFVNANDITKRDHVTNQNIDTFQLHF